MGGTSFPIYGRLVFRRGNRKTGIPLGKLDFISRSRKRKNISTSSAASLQIKSPPARMSWVPGCKKKQSWTSWKLLGSSRVSRTIPHQYEEKGRNSQQVLFSFVRGLLPWAFSRCQGTWEADTWEHTSSWSKVQITFILSWIGETNISNPEKYSFDGEYSLMRKIFRHLIRGGSGASTFQSIQVSFEYLFHFLLNITFPKKEHSWLRS